MVLSDNHGHGYDRQFTLGGAGCPQSVAPSSYITYCKGDGQASSALVGTQSFPGCGFSFGVGDNDEVNLFQSISHNVLIDTTGPGCCSGVASSSYGRTGIDGTGPFAVLPVRTPGLANVWTIMISEVADKGNANDACNDADYVELFNPTSSAISLVNLVISDDNGHGNSDRLVLGAAGCPQSLPANTYMFFCRGGSVTVATPTPQVVASGCSFAFGVGGGDTVNLYSDPTASHHLIDSTPGCCAGVGSQSYGRLSPITAFETMARTPGVANQPLAAPPPPAPGCMQSTNPGSLSSIDFTAPPGSAFTPSVNSQYLCVAHVKAARITSIANQATINSMFGMPTNVGDIRFDGGDLLTEAPYNANPSVVARSTSESDMSAPGASVTCAGNSVDVTAMMVAADPSLAGASCFACNLPSVTVPNMGVLQWLSATCYCGSSGCNGNALRSIGNAFQWSMPAVTTPTASARPVINEVADKGNVNDALCTDSDYIELYNPTSSNLLLSGLVLSDDNGHGSTSRHILGASGCPQSLSSAQYLLLCKDGAAYTFASASAPPVTYAGCGFTFGVGGGDRVDLFMSAADSTLLDTTGAGCCAGVSSSSYGRQSLNGAGTFAVNSVRTPGLHNVWSVIINEVADKANPGELCPNDYIEMYNPTSATVDITGMVLVDDHGHGHAEQHVLGGTGCPTSLASGQYLTLCKYPSSSQPADAHVSSGGARIAYAGCGFLMGIGGNDIVDLYRSATDSTLLDSTPGCCSGLPTQSYGRLTPASRMSIMSRTPGAVNVALPAPPSAAPSAAPPVAAASPPAPYPTLGYASLVITEVADKGDPNSAVTCGMADYIEL